MTERGLILSAFFVCVLFIAVFLSVLFVGCTYNVSMAHTTGHANDVIDDVQSNTPDITTDFSIHSPMGMNGVSKQF